MNSGINTSLTGLQANQLRADVAANNIANVSTPGFQPSRTIDVESRDGGVTSSIVTPLDPNAIPEISGTDVASELVTTIVAQRGFEANVKALRVSDRMQQQAIALLS